MGNDWTRLLQEAALKGGPRAQAGLKQTGRLQDIVIGGAVVGGKWAGAEIKSTADRIRERRREKAAASAAGNSTVVVVDEPGGAGDSNDGAQEEPRG